MHTYDIAVVGGGAAGMMAAIRAGQRVKDVVLLERGSSLGRKILLSGKGRCNVTNSAAVNEFIPAFGRQGEFLRAAFAGFFNQELMEFFNARGLELKVERQGRVFPITDTAASIVEVMRKSLLDSKVKILYNTRVVDIKKENGLFVLYSEGNEHSAAKKLILATGGVSFSFTGSSGDGFTLARKLGHTVTPLTPGLVPLKIKEPWVKELQGLTLKNVRLCFKSKNKKILSSVGELLFTHFGVSGPLVLDVSSSVLRLRGEHKELFLLIDLKPGLSMQQLEERLLKEFRQQGNKSLKNIFKEILPLKLIPVFLRALELDANKKGNQVTKAERCAISNLLKSFRLEVVGSLAIEEAMVTCGGVSRKEIDPRTMESRLVAGLYFAGEIIDASASSGGYNLQQAFSTGYLAGESAVSETKDERRRMRDEG